MNARYKSLILLFLFASTVASSQGQTVQGGRFSDLSLEVSSSKESFIVLEPIPVIFRLSNKTNKIVRGHATFRFSCGAIEMFVRNPSGRVVKIEPLSLYRARCISRDSNISPRSQVEYTELLTLDLNRYFTATGTYGLQAVLQSSNGSDVIRSPWLAISVVEPQGDSLAAYDFLQNGTGLSRAFSRHETDEQRIFFEAFSANYSNTPYAPYIQFNLAEHYLFVTDIEKAKAKLEKLRGLKNFVFASKVEELLRQLETKQKASK